MPPSVRLSVCLSHLGQLGAQRLGQATGAVRAADGVEQETEWQTLHARNTSKHVSPLVTSVKNVSRITLHYNI